MQKKDEKLKDKLREEEKALLKKPKFSKKIVTLIVMLNVLYAGAVLALLFLGGNEPTVLTGAWFAFTTGELWLLTNVKKAKIKEKTNEDYFKEVYEYESDMETETYEP